MTDYNHYTLSKQEKIKYYAGSCTLLFLTGLLFYRSIILALLLTPLCLPLKKYWCASLCRKRKEQLLDGFRDALFSISASVAGGRQLPQAIGDAAEAVSFSHGKSSDIALELTRIYGLYSSTHADSDRLLSAFAARSGIEEIVQFAQSCSICRKCGGDMEEVALRTISLILDRMDFSDEVKTVIEHRKLEILMLTAMPAVILLFLNLVSFSYLAPLYSGIKGHLIMTLCFGLMAGALLWSIKLTDFKL